MKLDKELKKLSEGATNHYPSERELAKGTAQVWLIQEIRNLTKTIRKLDSQNSKLNRTVLALTFATSILALIQIIIAIVKN